MSGRRYWFRRRRFGLGWSPKTWQGWAAMGAFVLVQKALPAIVQRLGGQRSGSHRKLHCGITVAFVALAIFTGEPL